MAKNPVVFQNGTLVQKATVEIDGNVYEVEPAQYEGTTPLSANNLNRLQDNLYDYVDEEIDIVNENIENIKAVSKDNLIVVEKTININSHQYGTIGISYPTGFNKDNCFVLGYKLQEDVYSKKIVTGSKGTSSEEKISPYIYLDEVIYAKIYNSFNFQAPFKIEILLMKIS